MHLVHIPHSPFRTEMCTFLFWMEHCGIWTRCILGFVKLVYCSGLLWFCRVIAAWRVISVWTFIFACIMLVLLHHLWNYGLWVSMINNIIFSNLRPLENICTCFEALIYAPFWLSSLIVCRVLLVDSAFILNQCRFIIILKDIYLNEKFDELGWT